MKVWSEIYMTKRKYWSWKENTCSSLWSKVSSYGQWDEFRIRKPNCLKINPSPENITETNVKLGSEYSVETLWGLERVGNIEPLEYDAKCNVIKAFKSGLPLFHPTCHVPSVKFSDDLNISPVEGYRLSHWQSMQNIQCIADMGDCNKYCIKYIVKIDSQNYVIFYSYGHTNFKLITKTSF